MAQDTNKKAISAIDAALKKVEKKYGVGAAMRLDKEVKSDVEAISTGITGLDYTIGIGGIPRGRVTEIFGPEGVGKTTLCYTIMAATQAAGGIAMFIDAEHNCDIEYAGKLGVKFDKLVFSQPPSGEAALDIVNTMLETCALDIIMIDSVAGLTPLAMIESDNIAGQQPIAGVARLMSQTLSILPGKLRKSKTALVFTNQIRQKINTWGGGETTTGGNALRFWAKVRLDIRKTGLIGPQDKWYGQKIKIRTVKNNLAKPYQKWEGELIFGKGFNKFMDVMWTAQQLGIVEQAGAYYKFGGGNIAMGFDNSVKELQECPELYNDIRDKVLRKLKKDANTDSDTEGAGGEG